MISCKILNYGYLIVTFEVNLKYIYKYINEWVEELNIVSTLLENSQMKNR